MVQPYTCANCRHSGTFDITESASTPVVPICPQCGSKVDTLSGDDAAAATAIVKGKPAPAETNVPTS